MCLLLFRLEDKCSKIANVANSGHRENVPVVFNVNGKDHGVYI